MGVYNFVLLALFAFESFAIHLPQHQYEQEVIQKVSFGGRKWVVLVAGSRGWNNYRHQADISHAYQIMRRNGIPKENIITMMVDDIAYNEANPTPGIIINKPNGVNVYDGVEIDYKGEDVNPENFLNIIKGNKKAMASIGSGKVFEGGHRDSIFINFVDHGSTGVLVFPNSHLYADQLNEALNYLYKNKMYQKALLYIESCESGSMFDGLLRDNTNILAITAAGPRESSWGCYCNQNESAPYHTCLGDYFSVTWMENLDDTAFELYEKKRSVFKDFKDVRTNVTMSNVMLYGDFDVGHEKLSAFIGYSKNNDSKPTTIKRKSTLSSRDIEETVIRYKLDNEKDSRKKHELAMKLHHNNEMRLIIDTVLRKIYSNTVHMRPDIKKEIGEFDEPQNLNLSLEMFPCYRSILNKITETCFSMAQNPYVLDRLKIFANICIVDNQIDKFVNSIVDESCLNIPINIINVF